MCQILFLFFGKISTVHQMLCLCSEFHDITLICCKKRLCVDIRQKVIADIRNLDDFMKQKKFIDFYITTNEGNICDEFKKLLERKNDFEKRRCEILRNVNLIFISSVEEKWKKVEHNCMNLNPNSPDISVLKRKVLIPLFEIGKVLFPLFIPLCKNISCDMTNVIKSFEDQNSAFALNVQANS